MNLRLGILLLVVLTVQTAWTQHSIESPAASAVRLLMQEQGTTPPEGEPVKCALPSVFHALNIRQSARGSLQQSVHQILTRPSMQTNIVRGEFRVHFDTTGVHTPAMLDQNGARLPNTAFAYVDSIFVSLAYIAPLETQTLGYGTLPSDGTLGGGPEYDIFVMELGAMYGYATPDTWPPEGGTSSTFITIDNDFVFVRPLENRGLPGLRVTLAHELHHALQIGNYGYWTEHVFFYEITSTWMEDVVYPDVDDYLNYLGSFGGHFRNPDKSFSSNEIVMYSRSLWGHYVSKKFGRDLMRASWEQIRIVPPLQAIDRALRNQNSDFSAAFTDWTLWNVFTGSRSNPEKYYPDGADYPSMIQVPVEFTPPTRDVQGSLPALGSRYYEVIRPPDTMTVILNNMDLAGAGSSSPPTKSYTYHFQSSRPDETYLPTPLGIFAFLEVADLSAWTTWYVQGDSIGRNFSPETILEGRPIPSPFMPAIHTRVGVPVGSRDQVRGSLYIYSAGMDLVYAGDNLVSGLFLDRQMFFWEGKDNDGRSVPSGVYFFVLDLADGRLRGKIALVRR